jgi:UDP-N-acetylglucosamine--N-acetylmuramyl-(pentapeptide) pyrophosphoryl-undecaprenol N-acetylglucosamine transferase
MSIVFTGGGTGGHLAIIDSIKNFVNGKKIYIGSTSGLDKSWFKNDNSFEAKYFLDSKVVMDKKLFGKIKVLLFLIKEIKKAREILKKENAKVLFCVGGYSAAPASIAALSLKIPLVIQEQNSVSGVLNRFLKPFAKEFISAFEPNSVTNSYPIKKVFFENARVRKELKTILIIGGSQGSMTLNNLALELVPILIKRGIKVYHQAGEKNIDTIKKEYQKLGIKDVEVFGFSKELPKIITQADFAISRAGASTLWELTANGLPALYVPYPYAVGDHQYYNAKYLVDKNLAYVCRDKDLNVKKVLDIIDNINLEEISTNLPKQIQPSAAKDIAKYLDSF